MTLAIQSMLFVPGTKPDRFAKALASGADCVCIDLEDAVPADEKDAARAAALDAVAAHDDARLAIRINGMMTRAGLADALALAAAAVCPALVFVPMVESPVELAQLRAVLGHDGVRFVPLIETVAGLRAADAIAADPSTAMLMFGGGDFSAQLGVPPGVGAAGARPRAIGDGGGRERAFRRSMCRSFISTMPPGWPMNAAAPSNWALLPRPRFTPRRFRSSTTCFRPSAAELVEAQERARRLYAAGGYRADPPQWQNAGGAGGAPL